MRSRKLLQTLLLPLLVALALPALASADSLVFVKGGDVWLSQPDGVRQTRLTQDGGYRYASQSENGVIAASRGSRVIVLSRRGTVEASYPTSVGDNEAYGPFDTEISPDGRHIAYEYFHYSDFWGLRIGVAYLRTASGEHVGETHTGWSYPAWIDDSRLAHSGAPSTVHTDVMIREVGEPNNTAVEWFTHDAAGDLRDGDISRNGSKLVFVGGEDGELMFVYRFSGEIGIDLPEYCYHYLEPRGKYRDPAISPDGSSLAWQEDDGIHVGPLPDLSGGCATAENEGRLVVPGAINPDWGPANVPAPDKPRIRQVGKQKLRPALRNGLSFKVTGVPAGTQVKGRVAAATAKRLGLGRKATVVATGKTSSALVVRLKFRTNLVRKLHTARTLPLQVTAGAARAAITLRR